MYDVRVLTRGIQKSTIRIQPAISSPNQSLLSSLFGDEVGAENCFTSHQNKGIINVNKMR
jgi:hypothetical protein